MEQQHNAGGGRRIRRRDFIALFGAAPVWFAPLAARAEDHTDVPRLALVSLSDSVAEMSATSPWRAFYDELGRRGRIEGKTILVERYTAAARQSDLRSLAAAVVARNPDLIFVQGNYLAEAFQAATRDIPIVATMGDPVSWGLVPSLSHPGGNLTGASADPGPGITGKRLEILHEAVPHVARVAYLGFRTGWERLEGPDLRAAAPRFGIEMVFDPIAEVPPGDEQDYRRVFRAFAENGVGGIVVGGEVSNVTNRQLIAALALSARLPVMYPYQDFADIGALLIYGFESAEIWRRAADVADEILKGAKPGDIPIEQPKKFELIINLKTASAIGITIPPPLVLLADKVIE